MPVQIAFLNLLLLRQELRRRADLCLEARPEVQKIILFGSVARGDAVPGSDADLLILVDHELPDPFLRGLPYVSFFEGLEVPAEVQVFSAGEWLRGSPVMNSAAREGIVLAERGV
ncbi:MAG: nucleotidyltransferase domain-containing protein [Spirochaetales bacterium]|nr:nucleotidyltransferase domain-containing protein [Spirochaetales bacterium]